MSGILYICGTPIGNLEDISLRVLRILKEVDLIAAEDTRHTIKLLNYFEIKTPLTSYHEHNKEEKGEKLIQQLKEGKNIALVSDAGMPCISDPGENIIKKCYMENITITCAPGPTAVTTALALSGITSRSFIFEGFLPTSKSNKIQIINSLKSEARTVVFYEAPHHVIATLSLLYEILGNRNMAIAREITKKYEQIIKGNISHCIDYFKINNPKGEMVLVMEGLSVNELAVLNNEKWEEIPLSEHIKSYIDKGYTEKEAIKLVAKDRKTPKREIYSAIKL